MATVSPVNAAAACAAAAAAVCAAAAMVGPIQSALAPSAAAPPAAVALGVPAAVRLAKQAAFGSSTELVTHMAPMTLDAWLDEQFAANESSYADLATRVVAGDTCNILTGAAAAVCNRDYMSPLPVQMRFYASAVMNRDQLRQRVAFALSQQVVASGVSVRSTAGAAAFNQILLSNAFGNYRDILTAVTLNPYMGNFLDLAGSNRTSPNENYARELMQLFSLGVNLLNQDGTLKLDANGAPQAAYGSADVHAIARALTGWNYARVVDAAGGVTTSPDYSKPMIPAPNRYDTGAKTFLGRTVPAGAAQTASLAAVMDAVFNHPNIAPFISKGLIQQLVLSNPSPAYVRRVADVFDNNGSGVRGDLKAVVRAILTDPEARDPAVSPAAAGKVKEPALLEIALARAINMSTDGYAFTVRDAALGQEPFFAPSVFNFYPPDYPLPLSNGLISPPSKLMTTATVIARHNLVYDWTVAGDPGGRPEFTALANLPGATGTQPDWTSWAALNVDQQLAWANLILTENQLTTAQLSAIRAAMMAVTNPDQATQARKRAQTALYLVASSPLFQSDR